MAGAVLALPGVGRDYLPKELQVPANTSRQEPGKYTWEHPTTSKTDKGERALELLKLSIKWSRHCRGVALSSCPGALACPHLGYVGKAKLQADLNLVREPPDCSCSKGR